MRKFEIISLSVMTTAGRTSPFASKAVEQHDVTFIAITPVSLNRRVWRWWGIGQARRAIKKRKIISLGPMTAARGTTALVWIPVEKKIEAFITVTPIMLVLKI